MKNIFRKSVQIFHKKDKDKSGSTDSDSSRDSSRGGSSNELNHHAGGSVNSNSSKKDKKSKRHSKSINSSDVSASSESPQSSLRGSPAIYSQQQQQQQIPQVIVSKPSARKVFGVALQEVPCNLGTNVPIIVEKLVEHLERSSLSTEGLFRIPGRDVTILEFVRLFDNFEEVDVSSLEPYTAAGLLKRFFRDLPVFVPAQINKMVASLFVSEDGKKKQIDMEILERLRYLVHCLPPVHFEVMQSLTSLLSKLLLKSEENKMTVTNIAICLVPTLNCVPAIVTYPIQYHDFFFSEPFAEHHVPSMRPVLSNFLSLEEKPELITEMQKRYSRPASITISGLLPTSNGNTQQSSSPSSSTITSTTITSPHDSVTPITFTVTTTYLDQQEQQLQQQQQQLQQQQQQQQQLQQQDHLSRKAKMTAEELQYQQFIEENQLLKNQYQQSIAQQPINNDNSSNGSNSNININNNNNNNNSYNNNRYYRRSVAFGGSTAGDTMSESGQQSPSLNNSMLINNSITKANIQQLKEKIDRYSKEKMRELRESTQSMSLRRGTDTLSNLNPQGATNNIINGGSGSNIPNNGGERDKEREKLYRYSVDFERFKERQQQQKEMQEKRCSRDISREIEREIERRLSPRERISMLLSGNNNNNNNSNNNSNNNTINSNRIGDRESKSFRYSISSQNQYNLANILNNGGNDTTSSRSKYRDSGNYNNFNRYSKDYRYSRELESDELDFLTRQQRSQSCFDDSLRENNNINNNNNNNNNSQYQSILLEQKMDKIRETMNNIRTQRDDRTSRDYTLYLRDMDELRASLQKESETSEFFAIKSLELVDKLRQEEEKNQKLMEEIQLMESYFALKEKLKRSKRHSITTRSRSPTLPIHPTTSTTTTSTAININNNNNNNNNNNGLSVSPNSLSASSSSVSTTSSSSSTTNNLNKDQMMNQLLRGGSNSSRKLVNLINK